MTEAPPRRWTEQHWLVSFLIAVAVATGVVIGGRPRDLAIGLAVVAIVAGVASLFADGFFALIVGVVAVGAVLLLFHQQGVWSDQEFYLILTTAVLVVLICWLAGQLGSSLRRQVRTHQARLQDHPVRPVGGSLGLLDVASARGLLEAEIERSRLTGRPLTVLTLQVDPIDASTDADGRRRLARSVARLVESQARSTDIPFATSAARLGVIQPDTGAAAAWETAGAIIDAAAQATYSEGSGQTRATVSETATLHASVVELDGTARADAVLVDDPDELPVSTEQQAG